MGKPADGDWIMKSLISNEKECYVCHTTQNLHKHHIYEGTANRKKSDQDGCWVYLCARHHNVSKYGVHFNKELELLLKARCQLAWEREYNKTTEDFIKRFGRNYRLED